MKKMIRFALACSLLLGGMNGYRIDVNAKESTTIDLVEKAEEKVSYYTFNALENGYESQFSDIFTPSYFVYAGHLTEEEAENLLDEMNIGAHLNEWGASIRVINPMNGETYNEDDLNLFIELLGGAICNVKVIGINEGATFVNNYISSKSYAVAGIMTYGGMMNKDMKKGVEVPAYLSNPCDEAIQYFVDVNDAKEVSDNVYVNKDNELKKVVIGHEETLAQAFENAWNKVLSRNYRQANEKSEFYMSSAASYTEPYILYEIPNYNELKVQYHQYEKVPFKGNGEYTWYEYIPSSTLAMKDGTVPLIVTLHGNGNDPRIQGDTTGWVSLAAKENFMVISPEWQNKEANFSHCDGLEGDLLIEWLDMIIEKYPQIDTSRIYISGLSAGANESAVIGIKYSHIFAGVAAVAAPGLSTQDVLDMAETYKGGEVPFFYTCGDNDMFGMLPAKEGGIGIFGFIQAYQKVNGIDVTKEIDYDKNAYYGLALDNQKWIELGEKQAYEGTLSNKNGVIMKLVAVKNHAHWNYQPNAQYMWDFLKDYRRDTKTGELIRISEDNNKNDTVVKTGDHNAIASYALIATSALVILYQSYRKKEQ